MDIWRKLLNVNVKNKKRFQNLFSEITEQVRTGKFELKVGEAEHSDYFLVVEADRMSSYFIHIVPKEAYTLFKEMQAKAPNDLLGFSVLAGNHNSKPIRVSCFGVQCSLLGKSLLKSQNALSSPEDFSVDF